MKEAKLVRAYMNVFFFFCDYVQICVCHRQHENCSQNCSQLHYKMTASIALPDLHKDITSAAPIPPSVKESGFFWTKQRRV